MNKQDFEKAQNNYMQFWERESQQVQTVAGLAYRAGVVWLLKELMHKPFDELAKDIVTLHREMTITGR